MGDARWVNVGNPERLAERGRALVKVEGRQVALFRNGDALFACNNRCPHEGYPLLEAALGADCRLTCNWHNWKFDLRSGETVVGGDRLRLYPVERRDDGVWIDLAEPPPEAAIARAKANLAEAMDDFDYPRMAREIARLAQAGCERGEILRTAILHVYERLEFGTTHAFAAAAEWWRLAPAEGEGEKALIPVLEAVAHMARDALREPAYPYADDAAPYDAAALVAAIEAEDEARAAALLRGALAAGLGLGDLAPALAEAALGHYADFGHSAIYVDKTRDLVAALGKEVEAPLLLALVRSLVYAAREDLIPEFRDYGAALEAWDGRGEEPVTGADFHGLSVREALARALRSSARPDALYDALLEAGAWNLLHFDLEHDARIDVGFGDNVNWLDFTHAVTFASAARRLCALRPGLWPRALLQMACFAGRNKPYVRADAGNERWRVEDADGFFEAAFAGLYDHGVWRPIIACHRLKTLAAARDELAARPDGAFRDTLLAGLNRYLNSPLKQKHVRRSMRQALAFVAQE